MSRLPVFRVRSALLGLAAAALTVGSLATSASAAGLASGSGSNSSSSSSSNSTSGPNVGSTSYSFTLGTTSDVTIFPGAACPQIIPVNYLCGSNAGVNLVAANTGNDRDLVGQVTEDFWSEMSMVPETIGSCAAALRNYSEITIHAAHGDIFMKTHDGSYCSSTNVDVEPFTVAGGTGKYAGATGDGTIYATQTKPMSVTNTGLLGYAAEVYRGTISLPATSRG